MLLINDHDHGILLTLLIKNLDKILNKKSSVKIDYLQHAQPDWYAPHRGRDANLTVLLAIKKCENLIHGYNKI
jgi:hypothetical protein